MRIYSGENENYKRLRKFYKTLYKSYIFSVF